MIFLFRICYAQLGGCIKKQLMVKKVDKKVTYMPYVADGTRSLVQNRIASVVKA